MITVKVFAEFPVLGVWTADQETKMGLYDVCFTKTLVLEDAHAQLVLGVSSLTLDGFSINLETTNFDLTTLNVMGSVESLTFASKYHQETDAVLDIFPVPDEEGAMTYFLRVEETMDTFKSLTASGWVFDGASSHVFSKEEVINGDKCEIVIEGDDEGTVHEGNIRLIYKSDLTLKEVQISIKKGPTLFLTEQQFDAYLFGVHNRFCANMTQAEFDSFKRGK